ncbi:MAG: hypothetical protein AVDCRST_MAG68-3924, partial [uncultured Gemmatimonadetes bacterium]
WCSGTSGSGAGVRVSGVLMSRSMGAGPGGWMLRGRVASFRAARARKP